MSRRGIWAGVLALAAISAAGEVAPASQPRRGQPEREHASVRLVSAEKGLRPGETNYLGLLFTIDDGWHIYWDGVNDSGIPPKAEWTAPAGFDVQPMLLPVPVRHVGAGDLLDHVYERQVLLIVPVDVPADAIPGRPVTFRAGVEWLVCQEMCLPGYADVMISLPVANPGEDPGASDSWDVFEATWPRVPQAWDGQDRRIDLAVSRSSVEITARGATRLTYYPQSEAARADDLLRRGVSGDGRLRVSLHPTDRARVERDPAVRFVVEATFPGEDAPVVYLVDKPLSELGG